jgi:hypothetical protein
MKNLAIVSILFVMTVGTWFLVSKNDEPTAPGAQSSNVAPNSNSENSDGQNSVGSTVKREGADLSTTGQESWINMDEEAVKPATELYDSAAKAIEVVEKGAKDYDDLILEQFVNLGEDCSWCAEFYDSVKQKMLAAEKDSDEQSYFAELLAISGRPENVESIVDILKKTNPEDVDFEVYADALEMTTGGDDVVKVLADNLDNSNPDIKESVVAAISNQGSALAIDTLYKHIVDNKISDGYYSAGIGPGEVIPDKEAFPLMLDIINKRDEYSPLFVKGLLNSGVDGLRALYETLEGSKDIESDRKLLADSVAHVTFDDDTEEYLKNVVAKSTNPELAKFANDALKELNDKDVN